MNTRHKQRGLLPHSIIIYNQSRSCVRIVFNCKEAINTIKHLTSIFEERFMVTTIKNYLELLK